ncbi:hypothetical protein DQ04_02601020 [Trypanosoma grayi]|uniref:hypothetical protein n=1 Tax=Trypanosoma grayi TaxID=71804 RepID=UPI0004F4096E|nr:hypothetical protein DQ04_02601020 [Trypanosoma grayi]KEG11455.1 hypothetical protein DQ04_02601020 [Trypanosoma grayi]
MYRRCKLGMRTICKRMRKYGSRQLLLLLLVVVFRFGRYLSFGGRTSMVFLALPKYTCSTAPLSSFRCGDCAPPLLWWGWSFTHLFVAFATGLELGLSIATPFV